MDASFDRINKLFLAYIQQVKKVYKLPISIDNQLRSIVGSQLDAVWIVDDDPNDQLFIKVAFKSIRPDIPVYTFNDGEALLTKIVQTQNFPKVVLLDLNMPRISGLDALEKLRSNKSFDSLRIVILTASSTEPNDECQKALAMGANQYYTKPSTYKDLVTLLRTITTSW